MEIAYNSKLVYLDDKNYENSKVLQLLPKTILYNKTKYDIKLLS